MLNAFELPRECALAIGIPLTEAAFYATLQDPESFDFAHVWCRNMDPRHAWQGLAERTVAHCHSTLEQVEAWGASTDPAATFGTFRSLLRNYRVVTLLTHWRCVPVKVDDVVDPISILRLAEERQFALDQVLMQEVERGRDKSANGICNAIIRMVDAAHRYYTAPESDRNESTDDHRQRFARVFFEHSYPGQIRRARALEFSDGMRTAEDVLEACRSTEFTGVLDLIVCNSILLKSALSEYRDCSVFANEWTAYASPRLLLYRATIERLFDQTQDSWPAQCEKRSYLDWQIQLRIDSLRHGERL